MPWMDSGKRGLEAFLDSVNGDGEGRRDLFEESFDPQRLLDEFRSEVVHGAVDDGMRMAAKEDKITRQLEEILSARDDSAMDCRGDSAAEDLSQFYPSELKGGMGRTSQTVGVGARTQMDRGLRQMPTISRPVKNKSGEAGGTEQQKWEDSDLMSVSAPDKIDNSDTVSNASSMKTGSSKSRGGAGRRTKSGTGGRKSKVPKNSPKASKAHSAKVSSQSTAAMDLTPMVPQDQQRPPMVQSAPEDSAQRMSSLPQHLSLQQIRLKQLLHQMKQQQQHGLPPRQLNKQQFTQSQASLQAAFDSTQSTGTVQRKSTPSSRGAREEGDDGSQLNTEWLSQLAYPNHLKSSAPASSNHANKEEDVPLYIQQLLGLDGSSGGDKRDSSSVDGSYARQTPKQPRGFANQERADASSTGTVGEKFQGDLEIAMLLGGSSGEGGRSNSIGNLDMQHVDDDDQQMFSFPNQSNRDALSAMMMDIPGQQTRQNVSRPISQRGRTTDNQKWVQPNLQMQLQTQKSSLRQQYEQGQQQQQTSLQMNKQQDAQQKSFFQMSQAGQQGLQKKLQSRDDEMPQQTSVQQQSQEARQRMNEDQLQMLLKQPFDVSKGENGRTGGNEGDQQQQATLQMNQRLRQQYQQQPPTDRNTSYRQQQSSSKQVQPQNVAFMQAHQQFSNPVQQVPSDAKSLLRNPRQQQQGHQHRHDKLSQEVKTEFQPSDLLEEFRSRGTASSTTHLSSVIDSAQSILAGLDAPLSDKLRLETTTTAKAMLLDKVAEGRPLEDSEPMTKASDGGATTPAGGTTSGNGNGDLSMAVSALSDVRSGTSEANSEMEDIRKKTSELVENVPWMSQRFIVKLSKVSQSVVSNWIRGQSSIRSEKAKVVCNTMKKLMPALYPAALNGYETQQAFEVGEKVTIEELLKEPGRTDKSETVPMDKFGRKMASGNNAGSARAGRAGVGEGKRTRGTDLVNEVGSQAAAQQQSRMEQLDRVLSNPSNLSDSFLVDVATPTTSTGKASKKAAASVMPTDSNMHMLSEGSGGDFEKGGRLADSFFNLQSYFNDDVGGTNMIGGSGMKVSSSSMLDRVLGGMPVSPRSNAGGGKSDAVASQNWSNNANGTASNVVANQSSGVPDGQERTFLDQRTVLSSLGSFQ